MKNWDVNYIKSLKSKYEIAYKNASKEEKKKISYTLYSLNEILDYSLPCTKNKNRCKADDFRDIIKKDLYVLNTYGYYAPIIRSAQRCNNALNFEESTLQKINVSNNRLLTFSKEFYSHIGGIFKNAYLQISRDFDKTIRIRKESVYEGSGLTFSIYGANISFSDIGRVGTIQDYLTINHENSHAITNFINPDISWDYNKYCFLETDSIFFEIVTAFKLSEEKNYLEESLKLSVNTLSDYLCEIDFICSKMDMYNNLSKKDLNNKQAVKSYLKNEVGYDKIATNQLLMTNIVEKFNYIVSYLTAIELYLIYRDNPKYALQLLKKIVLARDMKTNGYLDYVRSLGINPGDNLRKYIKLLKSIDKKGQLIHGKI